LQFASDSRAFEIEWVDETIHEEAVRAMARRRSQRISFVDQVSFVVRRRRGIAAALSFDPDFDREGFNRTDDRPPGRRYHLQKSD
jgi:predicted nucleic acid-binding protein